MTNFAGVILMLLPCPTLCFPNLRIITYVYETVILGPSSFGKLRRLRVTVIIYLYITGVEFDFTP